MDPTVTGALIAGGAALIGFGGSALTSQATLRVNRKMQRDQLLWDKQTALYEAIDAVLISRYEPDPHPDRNDVPPHPEIRAILDKVWPLPIPTRSARRSGYTPAPRSAAG
jgi:hypothetical protein